jgi:hypothetical protein
VGTYQPSAWKPTWYRYPSSQNTWYTIEKWCSSVITREKGGCDGRSKRKGVNTSLHLMKKGLIVCVGGMYTVFAHSSSLWRCIYTHVRGVSSYSSRSSRLEKRTIATMQHFHMQGFRNNVISGDKVTPRQEYSFHIPETHWKRRISALFPEPKTRCFSFRKQPECANFPGRKQAGNANAWHLKVRRINPDSRKFWAVAKRMHDFTVKPYTSPDSLHFPI